MLISAKDLLLQSIDLYRKHLKRYLTYSVLLALPTILIGVAGVSLGMLILVTQSFFTGITIFAIVVITLSILGFTISLALIRAIADDYSDKHTTSIIDTIKQALPMIIPAILVSILTSLVIFGGIILFIIPGIIFTIWFTFTIHALILDDKHSVDALKYSKSLVNGRWFGVAWRFIVALFTVYITIAIIQWVFSMILGVETNSEFAFTIRQTLYLLITTILSVLATPLSVAIPTILYLELKKTPLMEPINQKVPEKAEMAVAE